MADKSRIEWTDATWNPTTGCNKISPGCKNCYAKRDWARLSKNATTVYFGREFEDVRTHPERLETPLRWTKPRRIFVNSMSDLFHEAIPFEFVDQVFAVMALATRHTFQVLTKRPDRMRRYMGRADLGMAIRNLHASAPDRARNGANSNRVTLPLPNVWLGASIEDQKRKHRINLLRQIPAAVRFLSLEPLLEDLGELDLTGIHQVIVGGESGGDAARRLVRGCGAIGVADDHGDCPYCHGTGWEPTRDAIHWVTSIRDQCVATRTAFFLKQWGGPKPKSAGALLDGREWKQMPEVSR